MPEERDWGPIMAIMAHLYGFKPWDVERLSEVQLQMFLAQAGYIRLMDHMPHLTYAFSKYDDKAIDQLLADADKEPDPTSKRSRAWRVYIRQYQTDADDAQKTATAEPLNIDPNAAEQIVRWVESGEMSRTPIGSAAWLQVMPIWDRLTATADLRNAPKPS